MIAVKSNKFGMWLGMGRQPHLLEIPLVPGFCRAFRVACGSEAFLGVPRAAQPGGSTGGGQGGRAGGGRHSGLRGRTALSRTRECVRWLCFSSLGLYRDPVAGRTWRHLSWSGRGGVIPRGAKGSSAKWASRLRCPHGAGLHVLNPQAPFSLFEILLCCSCSAPGINFLSPASTWHVEHGKTATWKQTLTKSLWWKKS